MNTPKPEHTPVPAGYMRNALGHLVPVELVREQDKLRDQIARDLAEEAIVLNACLADFKARALGDLDDLVKVAAEKYGANIGGEKGGLSVPSYDGQYKIVRSHAQRLQFSEELEAAKALIAACIDRWSEGASANIRALVDRAFRTDRAGNVKTHAVLDLLRLDIDDDEWKRAMQALRDSIQSTGTAVYVRVYQRIGESDQYRQVPLDLASV